MRGTRRAATRPPLLLAPLLSSCLFVAVCEAACNAATFAVDFSMEWTPRNDAAYPASAFPGFSQLLCASHKKSFSLWAAGEKARDEVRVLAETGDVADVRRLLQKAKADGAVLDFIQYPAVSDGGTSASDVSSSEAAAAAAEAGEDRPIEPVVDFNISLRVDGSQRFEYLSCIAALLPSPDFFVGMSNRSLCDGEGASRKWVEAKSDPERLRGWDAGTDDGEDYLAPDSPVPEKPGPRAIRRLLGFAQQYGTFTLVGVGDDSSAEGELDASKNEKEDEASGCFPADEMLHTVDESGDSSNLQLVPMRKVRLGTKAISSVVPRSLPFYSSRVDSGVPAHRRDQLMSVHRRGAEPIFFFSHADENAISTFVQLETASARIRLSPGHYIYTTIPGSVDAPKLVAADVVRVGDHLVSGALDATPLRVLRVSRVRARGLYNPHTSSGDIVVSGVRVSCFTRAVAPTVARTLLAPFVDRPQVAAVLSRVLHVVRGAVSPVVASLAPLLGGRDDYHV